MAVYLVLFLRLVNHRKWNNDASAPCHASAFRVWKVGCFVEIEFLPIECYTGSTGPTITYSRYFSRYDEIGVLAKTCHSLCVSLGKFSISFLSG